MNNLKRKSAKNKRTKVVIEFDENKRTEYLTGFSKRKNERRKKAKEEEIALLKQKKKSLKLQKHSEQMGHLQSVRAVLDDLERKATAAATVTETVNVGARHTVTVTELNLNSDPTLRLDGAEDNDDEDESADEGKRPQSRPAAAVGTDKSARHGMTHRGKDDKARRKKPHVSYTHAHHRRKKVTPESRQQIKRQIKKSMKRKQFRGKH